MADRTPPHSLEAERALIGSVFIRPDVLTRCPLEPDEFFLPAHREVWEVMLALDKRRRAPDLLAVWDGVKLAGKGGMLDGGMLYLNACADSTPTAENAGTYARIVREKAALRRVIAAAAEIQSTAHGEVADVEAFTQEALGKVVRAGAVEVSKPVASLAELEETIARDIEDAAMGRKVGYVPTGIEALDDIFGGGMQPSWLVVPCGLTSTGKSSFGVQVCFRGAEERGIPALIFSCEMTARQMFIKGACNLERVNTYEFKPPRAGGRPDWDLITRAGQRASRLSNLVTIDETRVLGRIVARATAWRQKQPGPVVIFVDHIQKVIAPQAKGENREQVVAKIASTLKNLAKDLGAVVIAPAQLDNDAAKERRPPRLGDLRESKAIEHEADVVIGIHRPRGTDDSTTELHVLKNRDGAIRMRKVRWVGAWQGFETLETTNAHDEEEAA